MKRAIIASVLCIYLALGTALAGNNPDSKVAVHILPYLPNRTCDSGLPSIFTCTDINATDDGCGDFDIFPVFFDISEYKGLEYSLAWPGSQSCAFTGCGDLEIGGIVWPGDGISQVWFDCRPGPAVIPGWGWIYTSEPGQVSVVPHPHTGEVLILDCAQSTDQPSLSISAGVCGTPGGDPCQGTGGDVLALEIQDGAGDQCIFAGHYFEYEIVYENTSNVRTLRDVTLDNILPAETEFVSATAGGYYIPSRHRVNWQIGDLPPLTRDSVRLTVRIRLEAPPDIQMVDICLALEGHGTVAAAAETTSVCPDDLAPLDLMKDDGLGGASIPAGDSISYTITCSNAANPTTVHNAVLSDVLPPELAFRRASHEGVYTPASRRVTWDFGDLGPGEIQEVRLVGETSFDMEYGTEITNSCEAVNDDTRTVEARETTRVGYVYARAAGLLVAPHVEGRSCETVVNEIPADRSIDTDIAGCGFVHVFAVFFDMPEFRGVTYTLNWPEDWSDMAYTSCSDLAVGDIVHPGDQISQSWTSCRSDLEHVVIAGWGEVFSRGPGRVEMSNVGGGSPLIEVCDGRIIPAEFQFACGVCGAPGDDVPWGYPTRTRPTTWSEIKSIFR